MAWKVVACSFHVPSLSLSPSLSASPFLCLWQWRHEFGSAALYGAALLPFGQSVVLPSFLASFHMKTAFTFDILQSERRKRQQQQAAGSRQQRQLRLTTMSTLNNQAVVARGEQNDSLSEGSAWRILNFFSGLSLNGFVALLNTVQYPVVEVT